MPDLLLVCFRSKAAHQRQNYKLTVFSCVHMHSVTTTTATVEKIFPLFTRKASSFSVQQQITQLKRRFPCGSEFEPQLETSPLLLFSLASSTTAALTAHLIDVLYFLSPCRAVHPPPPSSPLPHVYRFSSFLAAHMHLIIIPLPLPFFSSTSLPAALPLRAFVRADVYGEHVLVLRVVPALLPPHAVRPSLPPPLPPLLHHHHPAAILSRTRRWAQGLYGWPHGALLPHQRGAHQEGPVRHDRRGGQVGRNHFLLWREVKQWTNRSTFFLFEFMWNHLTCAKGER